MSSGQGAFSYHYRTDWSRMPSPRIGEQMPTNLWNKLEDPFFIKAMSESTGKF